MAVAGAKLGKFFGEMFETQQFSDLTLQVLPSEGNQVLEMNLHKVVLFQCKFFQSLLGGAWAESASNTVQVRLPVLLSSLLRFQHLFLSFHPYNKSKNRKEFRWKC